MSPELAMDVAKSERILSVCTLDVAVKCSSNAYSERKTCSLILIP